MKNIKPLPLNTKKADQVIPKINEIIERVNDLTDHWLFLKKLLPEFMDHTGFLSHIGARLARKVEDTNEK